jgi:hypothetical protein
VPRTIPTGRNRVRVAILACAPEGHRYRARGFNPWYRTHPTPQSRRDAGNPPEPASISSPNSANPTNSRNCPGQYGGIATDADRYTRRPRRPPPSESPWSVRWDCDNLHQQTHLSLQYSSELPWSVWWDCDWVPAGTGSDGSLWNSELTWSVWWDCDVECAIEACASVHARNCPGQSGGLATGRFHGQGRLSHLQARNCPGQSGGIATSKVRQLSMMRSSLGIALVSTVGLRQDQLELLARHADKLGIALVSLVGLRLSC